MPLDQKMVERAAALARLQTDTDPAQTGRLTEELADLVKLINILSEAETSGVEPLYSPFPEEMAGPRPDEPSSGAEPEALLNQAPGRVGRFFAVPRII